MLRYRRSWIERDRNSIRLWGELIKIWYIFKDRTDICRKSLYSKTTKKSFRYEGKQAIHYQNKREADTPDRRAIEAFMKTELAQYYPPSKPDDPIMSDAIFLAMLASSENYPILSGLIMQA